MGVGGFVRSFNAAMRQMERESQRQSREAAKQYKLMLQQYERANAADVVQRYNQYITLITSLHKDCSDHFDWKEFLDQSKPEPPTKDESPITKAREALKSYEPSLMDKLLGRVRKKEKKLQDNIYEAEKSVELHFQNQIEDYKKTVIEFEEDQKLCERVLRKDLNAYRDVMDRFNPFQDLKLIGSGLSIEFTPQEAIINLSVNSDQVIPSETYNLSATGKLLRKKVPSTRFHELYQDYVCGAVIRAAREIFACLPMDGVTVNAYSNLLNTSTGHLEDQIILSVYFPAITIQSLNFQNIDPSDCMRNFRHNMKFSKSNGFNIVSQIDTAG